jgi:hypothetical protein
MMMRMVMKTLLMRMVRVKTLLMVVVVRVMRTRVLNVLSRDYQTII